MTCNDAIRLARAEGFRLELDGDDHLQIEGDAEPSDNLIAGLRLHKAPIIALLRRGAAGEFDHLRSIKPKFVPDEEWAAACADASRLGYGFAPNAGGQDEG
jgi:hypothetical protein